VLEVGGEGEGVTKQPKTWWAIQHQETGEFMTEDADILDSSVVLEGKRVEAVTWREEFDDPKGWRVVRG
jgi:hypothetical protein